MGVSLRRLEGIDLGILDMGVLCNMGGEVAIAVSPLDLRVRTDRAIPSGNEL